MFRLSPLSYIVVGVVLMLMIFTGFYFLKIGPEVQEINMHADKSVELDAIISPASQQLAVERVREAKTKVRDAEVQWKQVASWRTPSLGTLNMTPNRWQLVVNTRRWHGKAEADFNRWVRRGGVTLVSPARLLVPYPTDQPNELVQYYFNYPALPFPVAIWDMGTITVQGTWDQIMQNVRSWSLIPGYIASVRGLSISGTGNRLTGTYGLTAVVYVNTPYVSGGPGEGGTVPQLGGAAPGGGGTEQNTGTMGRPGGGGQGGPAPVGGNSSEPSPMGMGGR
ncbi:MAG: hypothetical protein M3R13_11730 [Armatimonadota bacterium]|nr:hypothetical protein [Armatimonadota bacterium]